MKRIISLFCIVLLLATHGAATPPLPCEFYGSVMIDNTPAPAGTVITGIVNGNERGKIVTETPGYYGGPGIFDSRLKIDALESEINGTDLVISFQVNGQKASQSIPFSQGDSKQLDLSIGGNPAPMANQTPLPVVTAMIAANNSLAPIPEANTVISANNSLPPSQVMPPVSANNTLLLAQGSLDQNHPPEPHILEKPTTDTSSDGSASVTFGANSQIRDVSGQFLQGITITRKDLATLPPSPVDQSARSLGSTYEITPSDCLFIPQATLAIRTTTDPVIHAQMLVIEHYNPATAGWEEMSTNLDKNAGRAETVITRSGIYGLFERGNPGQTPVPQERSTGIQSTVISAVQTEVTQQTSVSSPVPTQESTTLPTINPVTPLPSPDLAKPLTVPPSKTLPSEPAEPAPSLDTPYIILLGCFGVLILVNLICYLVYSRWWMRRGRNE